jgi:hypothetical protein
MRRVNHCDERSAATQCHGCPSAEPSTCVSSGPSSRVSKSDNSSDRSTQSPLFARAINAVTAVRSGIARSAARFCAHRIRAALHASCNGWRTVVDRHKG